MDRWKFFYIANFNLSYFKSLYLYDLIVTLVFKF